VLDAGTTENILAEFHQRSDRWRFRAVGQGYEEQLAGFAARHGVDIA
jgi:DNA polymerase-3 subunit epsilon